MIIPIFPLLGVVGLLTAFLLYPRLPQYTFTIRSVWPQWYRDAGFRAKLGSHIHLINGNNIEIDIHGLSFDLYYPDRWFSGGELELLGNVQDIHQIDKKKQKSKGEEKKKIKSEPLWKLKARAPFDVNDAVLMDPIGGFGVTASMLWDMVRYGGLIHLPSTGAVHIKADGKMPLTLEILCDNTLDGWQMEMKGIHCDLDVMDVGFKDMDVALERLKKKVSQIEASAPEERGHNMPALTKKAPLKAIAASA